MKKRLAVKRPKKAKTATKSDAPLANRFDKAPVVQIQADYHFSDPEKQSLGMKLATLTTQKEEIAAHRKDVLSQINAQMEQCTAEIKVVSNKLRSGFEVRPTDAYILFNDPVKNQKSYYRKDGIGEGGFVRSEAMLASDYEQELPIPDLPPSQKPPPAEKKSRGKKAPPAPAESAAGVTNLGDALKAAAAGVELPRVPVVLDEHMNSAEVWKTFKKAAKTAGWPEAALTVLKDETRKMETIEKMIETLDAHTIRPGATAEV